MVIPQISAIPPQQNQRCILTPIASFSRLRALAWNENVLYAARGYSLLSARITGSGDQVEWSSIGRYRPPRWRAIGSISGLAFRFFRDGFHALALLPSGHLVAALPKAIAVLAPGEAEFRVTHRIVRGTRPLHLAATPSGQVFWGEYFDNRQRDEVHIYASIDHGATWNVAYTFPKGAIRHVHNIVYDRWENCLWILTGDDGAECRILRASCDFRQVDTLLSGNQQARAVAAVASEEGLYFSSDTPFEPNHVYRLDRRGTVTSLASLSTSSIYGCRVGDAIFFSTMVEPSAANPDPYAGLYGSCGGAAWPLLMRWKKDFWPMGLFQYGNALLPDGENTSGVLAISTVAVSPGDLQTSLWRVSSPSLIETQES
jgi:hypothetical protein